MPRTILAAALVLALAAGITPVAAAEPETEAANAAIEYITSLQNADGGFPAFGEESAAGSTIDAVFALVAAGLDPLAVTADGNSPADYLESQGAEYAEDPGAAAKLALAVSAMGLDPANFGGVDLLAILDDSFDAESGSYGLDLFDEAFFILRRHPNIWFDLSGIPPSKLLAYFPRIEELQDRVLWGTDWPEAGVRDLRSNLDQFLSLPLSESFRRKATETNALRLFPDDHTPVTADGQAAL